MAIVTKPLGGDGDPERGYATWEVDYDDVNLRLTALRVINNSTEDVLGTVKKLSNGRSASRVFPKMQTTVLSIPTGASQRLAITIDPRGRIDGCDYFFQWPAP